MKLNLCFCDDALINKHLIFESILADVFRSQGSCETELVQVSNLDGAQNRCHKQTNVIIIDFTKVFDNVPHKRLLYKIYSYKIRGSIHK